MKGNNMKARKCTEADRERILAYIANEPEMNLFISGDIENYGVDREPVAIYAFENEEGEWDSLVLKYFDYYTPYSQNAVFDAGVMAQFLRSMQMDGLSGKAEVIAALAPYFPEFSTRASYMCRCNATVNSAKLPEGAEVRLLGEDDVEAVVSLLVLIDEFASSYGSGEAAKRSAKHLRAGLAHGSLLYGLFEDGALVSTAGTTAANSRSAMITSVATHPSCRGKGYASAVVAELCNRSFAQGKRFLCLFYHNPDAGRIYRRIGFEEIGAYAMMP